MVIILAKTSTPNLPKSPPNIRSFFGERMITFGWYYQLKVIILFAKETTIPGHIQFIAAEPSFIPAASPLH